LAQTAYLFGDSDKAAERLKLLAAVYQDTTRAFLKQAGGSDHFQVALDLGCGPGLTTHLIVEALQCERAIGLDASAPLLELARTSADPRVSFHQHDVTTVPFPGGPANLIFGRFLLTHLSDPIGVVQQWATQLKHYGLMLLEETDAIHTAHPVFERYLELVEAILASRSQQLYAGRPLAHLESLGGLKRTFNGLRNLPVRNCDAARMFVLNLHTWKDSEFIQTKYSARFVRELEEDLTLIAAEGSPKQEIEWQLRQAVWLRS
jgi:SAM-dependent methyltransferase